jgi:hypothetical protein
LTLAVAAPVGLDVVVSSTSTYMKSRRGFVLVAIVSLPLVALAQQPGASFVGDWQGQIPGIGDARLIVTSIKPDGQVEGRMEFALQSFVSTFGEEADSGKRINRGVVSGATLTLEAALGGKYELSARAISSAAPTRAARP